MYFHVKFKCMVFEDEAFHVFYLYIIFSNTYLKIGLFNSIELELLVVACFVFWTTPGDSQELVISSSLCSEIAPDRVGEPYGVARN